MQQPEGIPTCTSFINGCRLKPGTLMEHPNPGNLNEPACRYSLVDADAASETMDAADQAFHDWRAVPFAERLNSLHEWLDEVESRANAMAAMITRENGKGIRESEAEIRAALMDGRHLLEQAEAEQSQSGERKGAYTEHCPLGVFLLITPWNFPLATLVRKLVPALAYGNTAVVKPSEVTPGPAWMAVDMLDSTGQIPPGVANLVLGRGREVGPAMVDHPALRGISLTGSTQTGRTLQVQTAGRNVRLQLEMGGKNAQVVLADADLKAAAEAARIGAFSCAGQWCTGTSRVIVEEACYEAFCRALLKEVAAIRLGPGHNPGNTMGPVAYKEHFHEILGAIRQAEEEGASLLHGGRSHEEIEGCRGWFVEPTVFGEVEKSHSLFSEEIFGPVLAVSRAGDVEDAIHLANASEYGLSFSVFTSNPKRGEEVVSRIDAGICHINLHTAYRTPDMPVAGWKESGRGVPECGNYARSFYTQPKVVYTGP